MSLYYIYQNHNRCIGCFACEVHCKTNKGLGPGPRLCRIIPTDIKAINEQVVQRFIFMPCFHCEDPWCVKACPTGAMQKRAKDGIVFVEPNLCVGCKNCITACPWGIPQFNPETGKVVKCDYCKDRIDQGLLPACVSKCTTHALKWVSAQEASTIKREKFVKEAYANLY
ncbi:4Fe-4S dicluster domain-containing protein [Thermodesulfobacterium thermophilum]|uniref:4Fe-4S dicluster domain-containing protein n=1 Tax=Thermodesulfobacterium thermophilum TaxID=886 RepID=UPI0003B53343|nr:4Fe-4S dicluster domain-containing protein [Thermodesulfobacterium thermophilum]